MTNFATDLSTAVSAANITDTVIDAATGLLPVALPLIAVFIGINLVPKMIKKFAK